MLSAVTTKDNVVDSLSTVAMQLAIIVSIVDSNVVGNRADTLVKK
jgi:hypothetical protein